MIRGALDQSADPASYPLDLRDVYGDWSILQSHTAGLSQHVTDHAEDADARFLLGYVLYSSGDLVGARWALTPLVESNADARIAAAILEAVK